MYLGKIHISSIWWTVESTKHPDSTEYCQAGMVVKNIIYFSNQRTSNPVMFTLVICWSLLTINISAIMLWYWLIMGTIGHKAGIHFWTWWEDVQLHTDSNLRSGSNPGLWSCEETTIVAAPPCCPNIKNCLCRMFTWLKLHTTWCHSTNCVI